jgi:hypothetical protein
MFGVDSEASLTPSPFEARLAPVEGAIGYADGQTTSPIAFEFASARPMQSRVHALREREGWVKSLFLQLGLELGSVGR